MGGVRLKIAPLSYLSVQYGVLNSELGYQWTQEGSSVENKTLSIEKNVFVADVTVNF